MKRRALVLAVACVMVGAVGYGAWRLLRTTYTVTPLEVPAGGKSGFTAMPPDQTGITFANQLTDEHIGANRVLDDGSGVALGDIDGDGRVDVYFCSLDGDNVLYRNLGNWRFEDVTAAAGVACPNEFSTGATFADVDGDVDLDLIVTSIPGLRLFTNDGHGHFSDQTAAAGLATKLGCTTTALADVDHDGDLDLYVASYRAAAIEDSESVHLQMVNGKLSIPPELRDRLIVVNGKLRELGEPDLFFRNDGKGRFSAVTWTGGVILDEDGAPLQQAPLDWGLTVSFHDLNADGFADIYVCNDFATPDRIYLGRPDGKFQAIDRTAVRSTSASSMGTDACDVDGDGDVDFFVADMLGSDHRRQQVQKPAMPIDPTAPGRTDDRPQIPQNTLQLNRGDGTFAECAWYAGVADTDWSWTPLFVDVDLDGLVDLFVTNGISRDLQNYDADARVDGAQDAPGSTMTSIDAYRMYPEYPTRNVAFRNLGDARFQDVSAEWGLDLDGLSNGAATADLDGDGDLDLVVNNLRQPAGIYRNESSAPRVTVRVVGNAPNTQGIAAKVRLEGGPVAQVREVVCGGKYLSHSDTLQVFAAGTAADGLAVDVTWSDGTTSRVAGVRPNQLVTVYQTGASWGAASAPPAPAPMFEDVSDRLRSTPAEDDYDDFARDPLLPRRLSRTGPAAAWADVDGDGDDDLVVGAGRGGAVTVYLNDGKGGFSPMAAGATLARDATGIVAWPDGPGSASLVVGLSNFEDGSADGEAAARYAISGGAVTAAAGVPGQSSSTGPLAVADVDGDGDLDCFVGGRAVPGRYPEPAGSLLLRNDGDALVVDAGASALLARIGLVSGAVFTDVDADGDPDLVLALEWGPVAIMQNDGGVFTDRTAAYGLAALTGWWSGVTAGDFDGDGRMDLVATNWGLNSPYVASADAPAAIFYGDADGNGSIDPVEAYKDPATGAWQPVRTLAEIAAPLPSVRARFATFAQYAAADLPAIYPGILGWPRVEATTFAQSLFMNRGGRFEAVPLPSEAQRAAASGVAVADFDGDGHQDVLLAQNGFGTRAGLRPSDGGRGLLLRGDGKGGFEPVPGQLSGIKVYGDGRAAAVADFDGDGRTDVAVTQNGSATKLYRNTAGKPGIRVRLDGGGANPAGIGAIVRLWFGDRTGPTSELHAGSGYLSQDSPVLVLAEPDAPTAVEVRWPGAPPVKSPLPAGAREVAVARDGSVRVVR